MGLITITPAICIDENEVDLKFVRSSGPGGQNVNKVSTAVQLFFDVAKSSSLPPHVRERMMALYRNRMNDEGVLKIDARQFRTQERNRDDALERLKGLVIEASRLPKKRVRTKMSRSAKRERIKEKRHRGEIKKLRGKPEAE